MCGVWCGVVCVVCVATITLDTMISVFSVRASLSFLGIGWLDFSFFYMKLCIYSGTPNFFRKTIFRNMAKIDLKKIF